MNKLLEFASEEKHLPETSSLLTLCRAGATRCFVFHSKVTDELMPFACVQLSATQHAIYAQLPNPERDAFHFETIVDGGLREAVQAARELAGEDWTLLSG